jgi:hypothetical protein
MVERNHETTVDGVTAWAGDWKPQEDGSVLCWIFRENPSDWHQPAYVTYWPPEAEGKHLVRLRCLHMTLAESDVGIELLKEAKQRAKGESVEGIADSTDADSGEDQ